MQKYVKTGLLIITLAFPVLIFIFLKIFATNHYDLPYFVPLRDAATQKIRVSEGDTVYYQLSDFSFFSPNGTSIGDAQIAEKTVVVSELTNAPGDTVQEVIANLSRIAGMLANYPQLRLLTLIDSSQVSIGENIRKAQNFGTNWLVAVLLKAQRETALRSTFHLGTNTDDGQTISPNARLSLVDSQGYIRGYYDARDPEEIDRLMAEVRILEHNRSIK